MSLRLCNAGLGLGKRDPLPVVSILGLEFFGLAQAARYIGLSLTAAMKPPQPLPTFGEASL